jgi:hypothetical protein
MKRPWLPSAAVTTWNKAASEPPVIEKIAGLVPTESTSVDVNAPTNLMFSVTV